MTRVKSITPTDHSARRIEFFSGSTSGDGEYQIVFSPSFDSAPLVFLSATDAAPNQWVRMMPGTLSGSGVIVQGLQTNAVVVLGISLLSSTPVTANGIQVNAVAIGADSP